MDLYSRRILGWSLSTNRTTVVTRAALTYALKKRCYPTDIVFHTDRGSQYTSRRFRNQLARKGLRSSMGDVGACWDNAVVERFFGSLKHDWILKVHQPTRQHMKNDVAAYMRYYNIDRLHSANDDLSPMKFELSELKVSTTT